IKYYYHNCKMLSATFTTRLRKMGLLQHKMRPERSATHPDVAVAAASPRPSVERFLHFQVVFDEGVDDRIDVGSAVRPRTRTRCANGPAQKFPGTEGA